jgi:hypothetical protein
MGRMKTLAFLVLASTTVLGGCAVVPVEPYGPPVVGYGPYGRPPVVVVKPAYRYPRYYYGAHGHRYWR